MSSSFDELQSRLDSGGAEAVFAELARQLRAAGKYHELFDARLMEARQRLGLPLAGGAGLDELDEPLRSQVEAGYLDACREVGELLLAEGRLRDAWMYLRPAGAREPLADALLGVEPNDENLDELVELALHEGLAPERGFALVLEHYGTCNAITTFEGAVMQLPLEAQRQAAALLVRQLHGELLENVRAHIEQLEDGPPPTASLGELVAERPALFEGDSYHIDTSHLSATVRFARLLDEPADVRLALELTEYGRRLSDQFQCEGDEPFVDHYAHHGLLFAATLGERVEEGVAHFEERARASDVGREGTAAVETWLILLARLGRHAEALEAMAELVPPGAQLSPYAPQMLQLASNAGKLDRYLEMCRDRNDLVAFTAALVAAKE